MSSKQFKDKLSVAEDFVKVRRSGQPNQPRAEREPYNEIIDMLSKIEVNLDNDMNSEADGKNTALIRLAIKHLNKGILYVDKEELKSGEKQLMKCIELLKDKELEPEIILTVLPCLHQLGIIWSKRGQPDKAKAFFERAEKLYQDFTDLNKPCYNPINLVLNPKFTYSERSLNTDHYLLERMHTLTLYYLAQVNEVLKDHHKSAVYCHMTLRRQLEENITHDFNYIEWALNAATLSQYFMENEGFSQARHHLAAASYILQKYEGILKEKENETENDAVAAEWECFRHRSADVARCWAKYGLFLLSLSKKRLMEKAEKDDIDSEDESDKLNFKSEKDSEKSFDDLKFDSLMDDIKLLAEEITDRYLLDFNDAKPVFLNTKKWLDQAKTYYTLENHASDYTEIIVDISHAYKYLLFFEENEDRQAKMHKRRIDILEATVKELNPQYYKVACRQIWIELSDIYSDILNIKLDRLQSQDDPSPSALTKINHLASSGIKNIELFMDSLENNSADAKAVTFSDDIVHLVLHAYFQLGRLYNKTISFNKTKHLENILKSLNAYRFVIDYCEAHPETAELVKLELSLCREVVNLLPLKANKIREELSAQ